MIIITTTPPKGFFELFWEFAKIYPCYAIFYVFCVVCFIVCTIIIVIGINISFKNMDPNKPWLWRHIWW